MSLYKSLVDRLGHDVLSIVLDLLDQKELCTFCLLDRASLSFAQPLLLKTVCLGGTVCARKVFAKARPDGYPKPAMQEVSLAVVRLLRTIVTRPDLAAHVKHVDLSRLSGGEVRSNAKREASPSKSWHYDEHNMDLKFATNAFDKISGLPHYLARSWSDALLNQHLAAFATLLIAHVHNITRLTIDYAFNEDRLLLETMLAWALRGRVSSDSPSLSNLPSYQHLRRVHDSDNWEQYSPYYLFLPNVETLLVALDRLSDLRWCDAACPVKSLRDLTLVRVSVLHPLLQLLRLAPNLHSLFLAFCSYGSSCSRDPNYSGNNSCARGISHGLFCHDHLRVALSLYKHTLKELTLTTNVEDLDAPDSFIESFEIRKDLLGLVAFRSLAKLKIEAAFLKGILLDGRVLLQDLLPASLVTLVMVYNVVLQRCQRYLRTASPSIDVAVAAMEVCQRACTQLRETRLALVSRDPPVDYTKAEFEEWQHSARQRSISVDVWWTWPRMVNTLVTKVNTDPYASCLITGRERYLVALHYHRQFGSSSPVDNGYESDDMIDD